MTRKILFAAVALMLSGAAPAQDRAPERDLMVLTIENMAATSGMKRNKQLDPSVLTAMRQVPRHLLVPEDVRARAYQNIPLPIGYEATISQPFVVALMTDLLDAKPEHRVLEVGTGSGYQAAVLSGLVREVYTIEIVEPLAARAAQQLASLGYGNVRVRAGDGYAGWPEAAPFERIIVTAGADHIPQPLVDQLKPGGIMVIPVGKEEEDRQLTVLTKDGRGRVATTMVLPVRFVPLVRAPS